MSRTRKRKMRNKPYSWTILNKNLENWKNKSLLCHSELGICKEIYEEAMIMTFVYITKRKLPQTKSVVFFFLLLLFSLKTNNSHRIWNKHADNNRIPKETKKKKGLHSLEVLRRINWTQRSIKEFGKDTCWLFSKSFQQI